jgi:hypothetical protein
VLPYTTEYVMKIKTTPKKEKKVSVAEMEAAVASGASLKNAVADGHYILNVSIKKGNPSVISVIRIYGGQRGRWPASRKAVEYFEWLINSFN